MGSITKNGKSEMRQILEDGRKWKKMEQIFRNGGSILIVIILVKTFVQMHVPLIYFIFIYI